ncbi:MAG: RNA polymerase sigma factor [Clostridia bacterium]|nr:RNA polymerase sigma factor [Clostridia bacterium]
MDDFEITELYLKRDGTAILETQKKYGAKLMKLSLAILGDRQYAEECVNDSLMKAWESIPPNEPRSYLLPYLLRIARQTAINRAKQLGAAKRTGSVTELTREMEECLPSDADPAGEVEAKELTSCINAFLAKQSKQKRDMFVRRYWFCESVSEVASRFGFGESKVKTALHRMRRELKTFLEEKGYTI